MSVHIRCASTRLVGGLLLSFAAVCTCLGQTLTTARIAGTVRDTTGAVIVNARISAQNTATGEKQTAITDAYGDYVLTSISPGTYQITISAVRFASVMYSSVRAGIDETGTVNVVLKIASANSNIAVTDDASLVQLENAEISKRFDSNAVSDLPTSTRNFTQLVATVPGVNMPLTDNRATGRNSVNFSVNGARTGQNNLQINGVDANDISAHDSYSVAIPAPESISEVAVKTSMYDVNVSGAGGSVQVITKSGTNRRHGNVYEYFRNTALNANDPDLKAVGLGPPILSRNVYGVTLGGPIRKDRAFFFLSYQGTRDENGATDQSLYKSVFIAPVLQGSSGLTNDRSEATILRNFQGILPSGTTSIDPTALALLNFKLPNGQFLIPTPQMDGRVTGTAISTYREEQFNTNVDVHLGPHNSLGAKFFFADAPEFWALGGTVLPAGGGSGLPGFGTQRQINNRLLSVQWTHTFGSGAVNEARVGYNFLRTSEVPQEPLRDSDVGISRSTADTLPGLPLILLDSDRGSGGGAIGTSGITLQGTSPSQSLADVFSLQHAKHSLRLGGDFVRHQWDFRANVENYGEIDFPSFDQFLLGISDFSSISVGITDRNLRANDYDFFVQDDWKLSQKFTLNLGLRYQLDMPAHDTKGRIGGFDPSLYKPRMEVDAQGVPIGPPVGGIVMAGNALPQYDLTGVPRVGDSVLKSIDPNNFAPRVGFVWLPIQSSRLVLRGGYGIFYSPSSFFYVAWDLLSLPFYAGFNWSGQSFANPFPDAPRANQFPVLAPGIPLNISSMDRNNRTPYFQHFNTSLEYQFGRDTAMQFAYVGSRGLRLFRQVNINQARIASTNHPITNAVTGELITWNTPDNAQLRAPLQGVITNSWGLNQTSGQSTYHSLQAILSHRASHGLEFQAAYTFSKSIDDTGNPGGGVGLDGSVDKTTAFDTGSLDRRGLSDFDRTHRFVVSGVWNVPKFSCCPSSRGVRILRSNWQLSGILIAMSGLPVDILDSTAGDLYGINGARPNWALGANRRTATRNVPPGYYFNPFAFALPTVQPNQPIPSAHDPTALAPEGGNDIGSLGRNVLRGPSQSNIDLSIARRFPLSEFKNVEVRADFFNALNHANRSNPIEDITTATVFDASGQILNPGDFGRSLSFDSSPRIVQLALKFTF